MRNVFIAALIFMVVSCDNGNYIPPDIIKPPKMQSIFWDMIRGDLVVQEILKKDSTQNIKSADFYITEKILASHNTDRTKFKKSLVFYEKHPVLIKAIFDSLNARQTRKNILHTEKSRRLLKDFHRPQSNKIP